MDRGLRGLPPILFERFLSLGLDSSFALAQFVSELGDPELALFELCASAEGEEADMLEACVPEFLAAFPLIQSEASRHVRRMTTASHGDVVLHVEGDKGARLSEQQRSREESLVV